MFILEGRTSARLQPVPLQYLVWQVHMGWKYSSTLEVVNLKYSVSNLATAENLEML